MRKREPYSPGGQRAVEMGTAWWENSSRRVAACGRATGIGRRNYARTSGAHLSIPVSRIQHDGAHAQALCEQLLPHAGPAVFSFNLRVNHLELCEQVYRCLRGLGAARRVRCVAGADDINWELTSSTSDSTQTGR
jgi:hypothetical protein